MRTVLDTNAVATETVVDTREFTKELEWAARFAHRKTTIPILQNVAIRSVGGGLELVATDLETAGIGTVSAEGADIAVTVPGRKFRVNITEVTQ
jgi:DNA polymerase III sliding clamp (beta) subunit (PCNA family)